MSDSVRRFFEDASQAMVVPEGDLPSVIAGGRKRRLATWAIGSATIVGIAVGAVALLSTGTKRQNQSAGLPTPPESLRDQLPDQLDEWVRPGLVLAYENDGVFHIFFEGVVSHSCPMPEEKPDACISTGLHVVWSEISQVLRETGSHNLPIVPPPDGAEVLWRGVPEAGSIGAESPGACDRLERFEAYYECRGGKPVYVGDCATRSDCAPSPRPSLVPVEVGRIAYFSDKGKGSAFDVFVTQGPGHARRITEVAGYSSRLDWSPDGRFIVMDRGISEGRGSLVIVEVSSGKERTLLSDEDSSNPITPQGPSWSPDGSKIAFYSGEGDIYVIDSLGGLVTKILNSGRKCGYTQPEWSSDGTDVAYRRDGVCKRGIYVTSGEGGRSSRLTAQPGDSQPSWSPDGSSVAFSRDTEDGAELVVLDISSREEKILMEVAGGFISSPSWSPDGTAIVFASTHPGPMSLWIINADGSGERPLVSDGADNRAPNWGPD